MTRQDHVVAVAAQVRQLTEAGRHVDVIDLLDDLSLSGMWLDVRDFHRKFGVPAPESPAVPDQDRLLLREKLISEEACEACDALLGPITGAATGSEAISQIAHECVDTIVVSLGTLIELGVDPVNVWRAVQAANMAKVADPNGGKVRKPPGWRPADVRAIISRQMGEHRGSPEAETHAAVPGGQAAPQE